MVINSVIDNASVAMASLNRVPIAAAAMRGQTSPQFLLLPCLKRR